MYLVILWTLMGTKKEQFLRVCCSLGLSILDLKAFRRCSNLLKSRAFCLEVAMDDSGDEMEDDVLSLCDQSDAEEAIQIALEVS